MRRKEAGFIAAQAAIFFGVIALVSLPVQSTNNTQVSTSSTVSKGPLVFTSVVAPDGLQLKMVLNATTMPPNRAIFGNLTIVNTSNQNVTVVTVASQNMTVWDSYNEDCGTPYFMGFAVFLGHYTSGNISSAGTPLTLTPQAASAACPGGPIPSPTLFFPIGSGQGKVGRVIDPAMPHDAYENLVNVTTDICASTWYLVEGCLASYPGLVGDWNTSASPPTVVPFSPGEYTILAWDDWNQYVYATFVVEPSPQTITFASGASPDGLQLELTLNATTMPSNGAITGQVVVVNTSDQPVTVSTLGRSQNVTEWSNYINVCPSDYFMGYAVFGGHFTAANISSAGTPLRLVPPMFPQCPGEIGPGTITFLSSRGQETGRVVDPGEPSNLGPDQLNATTLFCNTTEANQDSFACNWATPGLVGYWNWSAPAGTGAAANFGFTSPAFFHFSPGEYTILAWDDWNQYVYVTFTVRAADTSLTSSATSDVTACGVGTQVITLSSTEYCAIDVANDTVIGSPGYSYFRNDSVTFEGVKFQTICPSIYQGCPGANSSASVVMLGIMRFTMTFPDSTNETASSVIADFSYAQILSSHSGPRAGMLIEITYGAHATTHVYLLVEKQP